MTGDRFIELGHDVVVNVLGAADDGRDHPKINHPAGEHLGHRRQPVLQRARKLHLTHRAGMAEVRRRRSSAATASIAIRIRIQLAKARCPHKQLCDRGQPLRDRRRLVPCRLTHYIDEVGIGRRVFEHAFDYATTEPTSLTHRPGCIVYKV